MQIHQILPAVKEIVPSDLFKVDARTKDTSDTIYITITSIRNGCSKMYTHQKSYQLFQPPVLSDILKDLDNPEKRREIFGIET